MEDSQEKITKIIDYFLEHKEKKFDLSFVSDCQEKLDEFGNLTNAQEKALDNIIEKWSIN